MNLFTTILSRFVGQDDWDGVVGWGMFGGPLTGNIKKAELLLEEHLITGRTAMKCVSSAITRAQGLKIIRKMYV